MDLIVESIPISKKGPHEETLSTDYLWFGPKDAKKLILHTSGVHGVEGFWIRSSRTYSRWISQEKITTAE